jgi:hypothetical protein
MPLANSAHIYDQELQEEIKRGKASISTEMLVKLPERKALFAAYKANISDFKFKDAAAAEKHFGYFNGNLVRCIVNFEKEEVTIYLNLPARPEWTVADWNNHFKHKAEWFKGSK